MITTALFAETENPGVTHVRGVFRSPDRPTNAIPAGVLLAVGLMTDWDLRSPDGYDGHTISDVLDFFGTALEPTDVLASFVALVDAGHLVVDHSGRVRIPEAIRVAP